jgi:hypothetical protein
MPGLIKGAIALGLVGSMGALVVAGGKTSSQVAPSSGRTLASLPAANLLASPKFLPRPGFRYTYFFSRALKFPESGNESARYQGKLFLDVFAANEKGFSAIASHEIEGHAEVNWRLKVLSSADGKTLSLFSDKEKSAGEEEHAAIAKDLLAQFFYFLSADTTGKFEATTEREGEDLFRKVKRAYRREAGRPVPSVLSSLHLLRWAKEENMPAEIQGSESIKAGEIRVDSEYSLRFLSSSAISRGTDLTKYVEGTTLSPSAHFAKPPGPYRGPSWNELRAKLANLDKMSGPEQLNVFGQLIALLKGEPAAAADLASYLKMAAPGSAAYHTAVGALATVGGAKSFSALRDSYAAVPSADKGSILAALTTTQAPLDAATQSFLRKEMAAATEPSLREGAAFALGSSLQQTPDAESSAALLSAYTAAQSMEAKLSLLDAMGNSGSAEFLETIKAAAASENPAIQAKALFSLRYERGAAALLQDALATGGAAAKASAVAALEYQPWSESLRDTVDACATRESAFDIKAACEKLLKKNS